MTHPMRAAIYVRKSTTHGLDAAFNSLDNQAESCRAFIRAKGWDEVFPVFSDGGFSGGTTDRPAFRRLMSAVEAGDIDAIVVHRLDRFSRSVADFARLLEDLNKRGVAVVSVCEGFDTSTASGVLMVNLVVALAQWERQTASERGRVKIAAARRKGMWTGGRAPYGYALTDGRLVIDEQQAEVLRTAFAALARGEGPTAVARMLNGRGWQTATGKAWTRQRLQRVIENRIYRGELRAGDEWLEGQHDAIIDAETFARAQRPPPTTRAKRASTRKDAVALLAGLIRCAACGRTYRVQSHRRKHGRATSYICGGAVGSDECPSRRVQGEPLEAFVLDAIRERIDAGFAEEVRAAIDARIAADKQATARKQAMYRRRIAQAERDAKALSEALATAESDAARALLQAQIVDAGARHAEATAALDELRLRADQQTALRVDERWVADALTEWHGLWALMTPPNRHRLLKAVVQAVHIDEPAGLVEVDLLDFAQPETTEEAA